MTAQGTAARPPVAVRRTGHAGGALTGAALLVLIVVVRIVLVVGIVGAAVGLVVAAISLLRLVAAQTRGPATP